MLGSGSSGQSIGAPYTNWTELGVIKSGDIVTYLLELTYDLCISVLDNVRKICDFRVAIIFCYTMAFTHIVATL